MKACPSCTKPLADNAVTCPACGFRFPPASVVTADDDAPIVAFGLLGCFLPLVGLVLYILWKDAAPKKANACGVGALIAVTGIPLYAIGGILVIVLLCFGYVPFE